MWNIELSGGEMLNVSVTHCHCISHLVTSFHHILHCIIWPSPRHTATFHVTPSFLTISPISYHTSTSRSTLFHFAIPYLKSHHWYRPHYASHHISHCIPFYITFHITPHSMYSTPHLRWRHILATLCITPPHLTITPHFTQHSCGTAFRIFSASFHHIWSHRDWSHPVHIPLPCFNIPHHTVHHHIIHPTTKLSHLAQHHLHYHIVQRSTDISCHSTRTNPYYTTTFHNPIPVWETRTRYMGHSPEN